tara:strand:- start:103 stop:747 length:645 start_codon:yes stop_codon:yes gene_type:complete
MNKAFKVSFAKAQSVLNKFRYKPRKQWSNDDRVLFKLCNFAVLSRKRLNQILLSLDKLSKLSDKSHYKYNELDIKLLKELILEKLDICFEKFKHKISIIKESDLKKIKEHLNSIKDENTRLENEIKRLNFIIENFIKEKEIQEISDVWEILNKKISKKRRSSKKQPEEKFSFDRENVKEFIKKWNQGHTTIEITESMKKVELNINKSKKKVYKI